MAAECKIIHPRGSRCNVRQIHYLLDFMTLHSEFGSGQMVGPAGRSKLKELWAKLTAALNQLGPPKSTDLWQRTWSDMKTKARRKCWELAQANTAPSNPKVEVKLTQNEKRIISIVGLRSYVGLPVHEDLPQSVEELQNLMDGGENDPLMDTPPLEYVVLPGGELQLSTQPSSLIKAPGSVPLPPPKYSPPPQSPPPHSSPPQSPPPQSPPLAVSPSPTSPPPESQLKLSFSPQPKFSPIPQTQPSPSPPQSHYPPSLSQPQPPPSRSPTPSPPQTSVTPPSLCVEPSRKRRRRAESTSKGSHSLQLASASTRFAELQQMQTDSLQKLSEAMQGFGERVAAAAEAQAAASCHMVTVLQKLVGSVDRLTERLNASLDDMQDALGVE